MADEKDIKLLFIKEALWRHGDYLMDLLQESIERKKLVHESELLENIEFTVKQDGDKPVLAFTFPAHGRFIEIRFYKSRNRQRLESDIRRNLYGLQNRKKKNTQWYTRNVMGSLNRLIGALQNEFSQEEIERLKHILDTPLSQRNTI